MRIAVPFPVEPPEANRNASLLKCLKTLVKVCSLVPVLHHFLSGNRSAISSPHPNPSTHALHKPIGINIDDDVSSSTQFSLLIQQLNVLQNYFRSLQFRSDADLSLVAVKSRGHGSSPVPTGRFPGRPLNADYHQ